MERSPDIYYFPNGEEISPNTEHFFLLRMLDAKGGACKGRDVTNDTDYGQYLSYMLAWMYKVGIIWHNTSFEPDMSDDDIEITPLGREVLEYLNSRYPAVQTKNIKASLSLAMFGLNDVMSDAFLNRNPVTALTYMGMIADVDMGESLHEFVNYADDMIEQPMEIFDAWENAINAATPHVSEIEAMLRYDEGGYLCHMDTVKDIADNVWATRGIFDWSDELLESLMIAKLSAQ